LEKIDMLDFADFVAINKFDRKGSEDALRDVRKQYQRNREFFAQSPQDMPVYGTMASRFNDDGVTALYQAILPRLQEKGLKLGTPRLPRVNVKSSSRGRAIVPPERVRYLAEISESVREFHRRVALKSRAARERQSLRIAKRLFAASDVRTRVSTNSSPRRSWNSAPRRRRFSNSGRRPRRCTRSLNTSSPFGTRRSAPN
jgi:methylmalonyl-CoA mutase